MTLAEPTFCNRGGDMKELQDLVSAGRRRCQVILLHAPSGYGKSRLTAELRRNVDSGIVVNLNVGVARALKKEPNQFARRLHQILKEALGHGGAANDDEPLVLHEAVKGIFRKRRIMATVENAHLIDEPSLSLLAECARISRGGWLLLEYTRESPHARRSLEEIKQCFAAVGLEPAAKELDPLTPEHTRNVIEELGRHTNATEFGIADFDGNLMSLMDGLRARIYANRSSTSSGVLPGVSIAHAPPLRIVVGTGGTREFLEGLESAAKLVLALVVVHNGIAPLEQVLRLCESEGIADPVAVIATLADLGVLRQSGEQLESLHETRENIVLGADSFASFRRQAAKLWITHYAPRARNERATTQERGNALSRLPFLYMATDDFEAALEAAQDAARHAQETKSRAAIDNVEAAVNRLGKVHGVSASEAYRSANLALAYLYYDLHLFENAYHALERALAGVRNPQPRDMVFKAALLEQREHQEEAIGICKNLLVNFVSKCNLAFELSVKVVLMAAYRSGNQMALAHDLFLSTVNDPRFDERMPEYGSLLKAAAVALDLKEAIPYLDRAAEHAKQHKQARAEIAARITLSRHYGDLGDFDEAEAEVRAAEGLGQSLVAERYSIQNNRAALSLYREKVNAGVLMELEQALGMCSDPFDSLIILNNMLICAAKLGNAVPARTRRTAPTPDGVETRMRDILDWGLPTDNEIRRISFYNLAARTRWDGKTEKSLALIDEAEACEMDFDEEDWTERFAAARDPNTPLPPGMLDHIPCLLAYWHIPISPGIQRLAA